MRWGELLPVLDLLAENPARGPGEAQRGGLGFYDRLVDELCAQGIVPAATIFHWDLPQALEDRGGWLNRDTSLYLADYAGILAERLVDRVPMWITLNEPFIHMVFGYALGTHAPGRTLFLDALPAAHHQLLGHGLAVRALRANGAERVLVTNNCTPVWPASGSAEDARAAEAYDTLHNRLFNDPVLLGKYPDLSAYGVSTLDAVRDGDLEIIAEPLDGLGVNYYNPTRIAAPAPGPDPAPLPFEDAGDHRPPHHGLRLARRPRRPARAARGAEGKVRRRAAAGVRHRERLLAGGRARPGRRV